MPQKDLKKKLLITGGTGYIGSHTAVEVLLKDYSVVIVDDLSNSSIETLKRIEQITGKQPFFYEGDINDALFLDGIFKTHKDIFAVIHFIGLKAISDSFIEPLEYFNTNLCGTITLLRVMKQNGVKKLVYSSSAAVYGEPEETPIPTTHSRNPKSPYGDTKEMSERVIERLCQSNEEWSVAVLRYFNPAGAHPSGLLGEEPKNMPKNLVPLLSGVAIGKYKNIFVYGKDYQTEDGTCIRDYLHVADLAAGHLKALEKTKKGCHVYNLGTGTGHSVAEITRLFADVSEKTISTVFVERRNGDASTLIAEPSLANIELQWKACKSVRQICRDQWKWEKRKHLPE